MEEQVRTSQPWAVGSAEVAAPTEPFLCAGKDEVCSVRNASGNNNFCFEAGGKLCIGWIM